MSSQGGVARSGVQIATTATTSSPRQRFAARYDVSCVVDEPGDWFVFADILVPEISMDAEHLTVLCCTPGGGCTGGYFDLGEPADGFSFAERAVEAGFACVLVDNLATGQSSPGADPWVSPLSVALANAEAFARAAEEIQTLLPTSGTVSTVGLGHSMGAMLTVMAQPTTGQHVAVACLGFTPSGLPEQLSPEELHIAAARPVTIDTLTAMARDRFSQSGRPSPQQRRGAPFPFNLPDTDPAGLRALGAVATNLLPLPGMLSLLPGNVIDYVRQITVPVFLGGGDHEPWHKAAQLVPAFANSNDISLYTLVDAAHNHNVARTREQLWRRTLGWAALVTAQRHSVR